MIQAASRKPTYVRCMCDDVEIIRYLMDTTTRALNGFDIPQKSPSEGLLGKLLRTLYALSNNETGIQHLCKLGVVSVLLRCLE